MVGCLSSIGTSIAIVAVGGIVVVEGISVYGFGTQDILVVVIVAIKTYMGVPRLPSAVFLPSTVATAFQ